MDRLASLIKKEPYTSSCDAMAHWPELETAVGARIGSDGLIEIIAPFGVDGLMVGRLTPNPKRGFQLFISRVQSKGWLENWPKLHIATHRY